MSDNEKSHPAENERVHGYEIKRSIVFDNDRGFALAENPNAPQPFVTWQFTENENGTRDFYWGHYAAKGDTAARDFENRVAEYQKDYGVTEKAARPAPEVYRYYSTQRPVDIGTFPKFGNEPVGIDNFDSRIPVEGGAIRAWGVLTYTTPLTEKQMADYELKAAPGNPDRLRLAPERLEEQVQAIGKWEQAKRIPDVRRLTWWYSDFGAFVKKDFVTHEQVAERYGKIIEHKARAAQNRANKKPIAEQLEECAEQAERDNAARPAPEKGKAARDDR